MTRFCGRKRWRLPPERLALRIAEEAATVDHISEGRFDFGIGRSGFPRVYDMYGIPYAESQARFREALEIILEAWKGEPFSYQGEHYRFENAIVAPRPYQLPHPPLRMAATTEETFPRVGQMGLPIFVGLRGMDIRDLRAHVRAYRKAWRDAGNPGLPDNTANLAWVYFNLMASSFQVSGPILTPENVRQGLFVQPPKGGWAETHGNPAYPLVKFAAPDDYTGINDAREVWWCSTRPSEIDGKPGSYTPVDNGHRYDVGQWPGGDPQVFTSVCP